LAALHKQGRSGLDRFPDHDVLGLGRTGDALAQAELEEVAVLGEVALGSGEGVLDGHPEPADDAEIAAALLEDFVPQGGFLRFSGSGPAAGEEGAEVRANQPDASSRRIDG
jgi:hypothetical protein